MGKHALTMGIIIAIAALGASLWIARNEHPAKHAAIDYDSLTATVFTEARKIPEFSLIDDQAQPFTNDNLKDHWSFVFFGFTNCGGICPTTMAELAKLFRVMPASAHEHNPQVVFITVDPQRDTTDKLRAYLNSFNPTFVGVTGDPKVLADLRHQLGILAMKKKLPKNQENNPDNYDHSGTILLVNPQGEYVGIFSMPHQAEKIADDFVAIANNPRG